MLGKTWCESKEERDEVVTELKGVVGVCNLCILRYIGVKEPYTYRDNIAVHQILFGVNGSSEETDHVSVDQTLKKLKLSTCVVCLGLLQGGIQEAILDKIVNKIKEADVEATSYCPVLQLPIAIRLRAYAVWHHLMKKFPGLYKRYEEYKPEGIPLKSAWKWVASKHLQDQVDPQSEWCNEGKLSVQIYPSYSEEDSECQLVERLLSQDGKIKPKKGQTLVSRQAVEALLLPMSGDYFSAIFKSPPCTPSGFLSVERVECLHTPIFVAGRYCKYSRVLSQTPWIIEGERKTKDSVEELIVNPVLKYLLADTARFSSSGREDVDVRTLGKGRPFVLEVVNPRKTIFSKEKIKELQEQINSSTTLISVRDLQIVEKKDVSVLKDGEEAKTKSYCALCISPEKKIVSEDLEKLNTVQLPLVLAQNTPVRVMHRRSVICRERSILHMKAETVPHDSTRTHRDHLFLLHLKTQAGTYVKEFVHGDIGRTTPSVSDLLGFPVDIIALDVEGVDLDWPPEL